MKSGTSKVSKQAAQSVRTAKRSEVTPEKLEALNDLKVKLADFHDAIQIAQAEQADLIEADMDVIAHYNPQGLGGAQYWIFQGIKVFPTGKSDEIMEKESVPMEKRVHPNGY